MRVTVQYLAQLKRAAGTGRDALEVADGSSLSEVVVQLARGPREAVGSLLVDEQGNVNPSLLFFVGEEQATLARPLVEGDTITILTPMAGG